MFRWLAPKLFAPPAPFRGNNSSIPARPPSVTLTEEFCGFCKFCQNIRLFRMFRWQKVPRSSPFPPPRFTFQVSSFRLHPSAFFWLLITVFRLPFSL
jgi:hypothetical protein